MTAAGAIDVLVVGHGLAGCVAALCARRAGARVAVASRGHGATALSSGGLEIAFAPALAAAEGPGACLAAHLRAVVHESPHHPFGLYGADLSQRHVTGGYAALFSALEGTGLDVPEALGWGQPNAPTISTLGCLVPVAMPLGPHRGWAPAQPWGVVHLVQAPTFAAPRVVQGVAADARAMGLNAPALRVIPIDAAASGLPQASPFALAQALDARPACVALGSAIRTALAGDRPQGLIVPPVLGLHDFARARQWLAEEVGLPIVEALSHLPSVPGLRLQHALTTALARVGISQLGEVTNLGGVGRELAQATFADGSTVPLRAAILATGRFIAGGVHWLQEAAREALLGLPLVTSLGPLTAQSAQDVLRPSPAEAHPLMTAGVHIDVRGRPLVDGEPAWDNLFAAGMVVGGYSARYQLCADGVALATASGAAEAALALGGGA